MTKKSRTTLLAALAALTAVPVGPAAAQEAEPHGTPNLEVVGRLHSEDGLQISYTDLEVEQEPARPYAYLSRVFGATKGVDIVSLEDPAAPKVIKAWRIEDPELHVGLGAMDVKYFKHEGRYYVVQSFQFFPGGPNADLGAVVLDVTGLPDPASVREVARIRHEAPGGFHNIFAYKHSSGSPLLIATANGPYALVYDLAKVVAGEDGFIGKVPWPATAPDMTPYGPLSGYHDFYAAWDPTAERDLLYGSGFNGYYVYDISDPAGPELVTSVVGVLGLQLAHTLSATPDAKWAVGQTEYKYSPVRIYHLEPGLTGKQKNIVSEASAWSRNWKALSHNHEMRWPYVFVSSYKDGLDVFDIRDPENPADVAYFDTYVGPEKRGLAMDMGMSSGSPVGESDFNGAFGVDVRNHDGLVVVSDMETGLWVLKLDGFDGWNGTDWKMPDISSVQKWDTGPAALVP